MNAPIALTLGDPAGVGPEIIAKLLKTRSDLAESIAVIGPENLLTQAGLPSIPKLVRIDADIPYNPGSPTVEGAEVALKAMERAAAGCAEGRYSAVVTGPISKSWCQKAGMIEAGQTEFFANRWGGEPTMAFVSKKMIVSLVTWHIPLMEVSGSMTESALRRTILHTGDLLLKLGYSRPKIGVCGLNPHAGEGGIMGREEADFLDPFIQSFDWNEIELSGTYPADTLFFRQVRGDFDAVIALYHDQGLGPLKTVAFDKAVNVTLGLDHIRTSPDHGTGFEIAGKGVANTSSFEAAVELAIRLNT